MTETADVISGRIPIIAFYQFANARGVVNRNIAQTVLFSKKGIIDELGKAFDAPLSEVLAVNRYTLADDAHRLVYVCQMLEQKIGGIK